ncbi:hypothetical protein P4O66_002520 [Electrophorus voltai]|uniref:Uncharacterized protein n=1 Tax=Electrophorus voltai TaxID=2609070 RepID=A0AAD9DN06_9TELE|nr:hypothetical protein P4O66_002520 [Electrophorus voltai]
MDDDELCGKLAGDDVHCSIGAVGLGPEPCLRSPGSCPARLGPSTCRRLMPSACRMMEGGGEQRQEVEGDGASVRVVEWRVAECGEKAEVGACGRRGVQQQSHASRAPARCCSPGRTAPERLARVQCQGSFSDVLSSTESCQFQQPIKSPGVTENLTCPGPFPVTAGSVCRLTGVTGPAAHPANGASFCAAGRRGSSLSWPACGHQIPAEDAHVGLQAGPRATSAKPLASLFHHHLHLTDWGCSVRLCSPLLPGACDLGQISRDVASW